MLMLWVLAKNFIFCQAVMAHIFNPITQEAEVEADFLVQGQFGLQSEFQGYTEKPCLKIQNKQINKSKNKKKLSYFCPTLPVKNIVMFIVE